MGIGGLIAVADAVIPGASQHHGWLRPAPVAVTALAPLAAAGSSSCSKVVAGAAAADAAVRSASAGSVVCLDGGTYAGLKVGGEHAGDVTIEPQPGQRVALTPGVSGADGATVSVYVRPDTSHVIVHGFEITGAVQLTAGDSFVRIDHNDISGAAFGIWLDSSDCTAPNAPRWHGCQPRAKIRDVTISGNRLHDIRNGADAIDVDNYDRVRVTGNEFVRIIDPPGGHVDCLQSTFGGDGLVFDHNYEHDNNCQGFFIKDGDVVGATLYDNLFLRDDLNRVPEQNLDVVNVYNLVVRSNTSWPGTGDILRDVAAARAPRAVVSHNVFSAFANGCCGDGARFRLIESDNIFQSAPSTFRPASSDRVRHARFVDPAAGDYRLARNPHRVGIDWQPRLQHYGP